MKADIDAFERSVERAHISLRKFPEVARRSAITLRKVRESMQRLGVALATLSSILRDTNSILREEQEDIYRAEWWKRGEGPPEFLARYEPQWWQRGEEPPPFGCAA